MCSSLQMRMPRVRCAWNEPHVVPRRSSICTPRARRESRVLSYILRNHCCTALTSSSLPLFFLDRLYFATLTSVPADTAEMIFFSIDTELHYEPFHRDFGPLNMAMLYRYVNRLTALLNVRSVSFLPHGAPCTPSTVSSARVLLVDLLAPADCFGPALVLSHAPSCCRCRC